jgi:integrase/recombinase XerD
MGELSPLRRRMIEDMKVRNLSPATQEAYVRAVETLSRHFGRSPGRLNLEEYGPSRCTSRREAMPGRR